MKVGVCRSGIGTPLRCNFEQPTFFFDLTCYIGVPLAGLGDQGVGMERGSASAHLITKPTAGRANGSVTTGTGLAFLLWSLDKRGLVHT